MESLVLVTMAARGYIFSLHVGAVIIGALVHRGHLASVVNSRKLVLAVKSRNLADDDKPLK